MEAITFTLFPNDGDMVEYSTDGMSSGVGLDPDGLLPAGATHVVLLQREFWLTQACPPVRIS